MIGSNRAIRVIRAKKVLVFLFYPPPADGQSPEIRLLISGEQIGSNRAIREIRAKNYFLYFPSDPPHFGRISL